MAYTVDVSSLQRLEDYEAATFGTPIPSTGAEADAWIAAYERIYGADVAPSWRDFVAADGVELCQESEGH